MSEELSSIDKNLLALEQVTASIKRRRTPQRIDNYYRLILQVKEDLIRLRRKLRRFTALTPEDETDKIEANDLIEDMLSCIKEREWEIDESPTDILVEDVKNLRIIFAELSGSLPVAQIMFSVNCVNIPQEIEEELKLDLQEIRTCFYSDAFRSAIAMCGRILELLLSRKYFETRNIDPLEEKWPIGTLIKKCFEDNVINDQSIAHMSNLINSSRIASVHNRHRVFKPSREETKTIIEFTIGLLRRLYPPSVPLNA
ncbi:MAG: DUF4145 domain-containing protein [Candidatus Bathyarchaeota archaeon]|nr:DUF4145 domain-containing protein [Candidatus Bathyarchaeota archaeon]